MKKRILIITTSPYYKEKGSSLRIRKISEILSKEYQVDLISYPTNNIENKKISISQVKNHFKLRTEVGRISFSKIIFDIQVLFKTFFLLKKNNYQVIHAEDFEAAIIAFILKPFSKKTKYIYDLHNSIIDNLEINNYHQLLIKLAKKIENIVINIFNGIIINWKLYENYFPQKKKFLYYDNSSVNTEKTLLPSKRKFIVYSGNYKPYQGVENLIKVYSKKEYNFDLFLIGNLTPKMKKLIANNKNIYELGKLEIEKNNFIIKKAIASTSPRIKGKQPGLKNIQHLLLGKLTIASNSESNKEILNKNISLIYRNNKELEKILDKINNNEINYQKFEKNIRREQLVFKQLTSEKYFLENYQKLIE